MAAVERFNLTECEMVTQRIIAIQSGAETGRRSETLFPWEISTYDKGTKDYIETNMLLDFASELLWKVKEKADRPSQVCD